MSEPDEAAKGRALSSPLRLRILRMCLHQPRTNKEIADRLGINPASCLHHVRTLVATGFLEPQPERRGARGAKEVPYLATRKSWSQHVDGVAPVLIETFVQETAALAPEDIAVWRVGLKLNQEHRDDLMDRLGAIVDEFVALPSDPDGEAISLLIAQHRDAPAD